MSSGPVLLSFPMVLMPEGSEPLMVALSWFRARFSRAPTLAPNKRSRSELVMKWVVILAHEKKQVRDH